MKTHRNWTVLALSTAAIITINCGPVLAQDKDDHMGPQHVALRPSDLQWQAAPPGLPPGGQMAVLNGDPTKPGLFTIRFKVPAGYKIYPHWHPADENVTILSGTMSFGMGDEFNESKMQTMPAGSFACMPKTMHHFAAAKEETIIQLHGIGPWAINYVNSTDDPRNNTPAMEKTPVRSEEK